MQQNAECVEEILELKSITDVGRWYMKEYGFTEPLDRAGLMNFKNLRQGLIDPILHVIR